MPIFSSEKKRSKKSLGKQTINSWRKEYNRYEFGVCSDWKNCRKI